MPASIHSWSHALCWAAGKAVPPALVVFALGVQPHREPPLHHAHAQSGGALPDCPDALLLFLSLHVSCVAALT